MHVLYVLYIGTSIVYFIWTRRRKSETKWIINGEGALSLQNICENKLVYINKVFTGYPLWSWNIVRKISVLQISLVPDNEYTGVLIICIQKNMHERDAYGIFVLIQDLLPQFSILLHTKAFKQIRLLFFLFISIESMYYIQ